MLLPIGVVWGSFDSFGVFEDLDYSSSSTVGFGLADKSCVNHSGVGGALALTTRAVLYG